MTRAYTWAAIAGTGLASVGGGCFGGSVGAAAAPLHWDVVAPMPYAVRSAAAESDGARIFVFGGTDPSGRQSTYTQIFDPSSGTWTTGSPMPEPAEFLKAVAASDGIHVLGGVRLRDGTLDAHRLYHPSTDSWDILPPMPIALHGPAVEAVDGRLYVIGGTTTGFREYTGGVHIYDVQREVWSTGESLPSPRLNAASVVLGRRIHVIGGQIPYLETTAQHLAYDVDAAEWDLAPPLPAPAEAMGAGIIANRICVFGGRLARAGRFNIPNAGSYCLASGSSKWVLSRPLPAARAELASITLRGVAYAIGGHDANDVPQATVARLTR